MILAVIPARGGSRGLPGKNLRRIRGEPMIAYTIRASLRSRRIDRTIVSTDDTKIAEISRALGAEVPFMRPDDLAQDDTPTLPVIDHAVRTLEAAGASISLVVTLQPTSPLRGPEEIDEAIDLLERSGARSAVSVALLGMPSSVLGSIADGRFQSLSLSTGARAARQLAPPAARITGAIYVTSRGLLAEGRLLDDAPAALVTAGAAAIDVDDQPGLIAVRRAVAGRAR